VSVSRWSVPTGALGRCLLAGGLFLLSVCTCKHNQHRLFCWLKLIDLKPMKWIYENSKDFKCDEIVQSSATFKFKFKLHRMPNVACVCMYTIDICCSCEQRTKVSSLSSAFTFHCLHVLVGTAVKRGEPTNNEWCTFPSGVTAVTVCYSVSQKYSYLLTYLLKVTPSVSDGWHQQWHLA